MYCLNRIYIYICTNETNKQLKTNKMATTTSNGSTYTGTEIKVKNTRYNVVVVTGASNYVNILKITANPYGYAGKRFNNFNEAISNYKNPTMKIELLKLEALGY